MNLHLLTDDKFADGAIAQFEKYYTGQNIFIVNKKSRNFRYITNQNVQSFDFENYKDVKKIVKLCKQKGVKNVLIHFLNYFTAGVANLIRNDNKTVILHWIFFGGDLYSILSNEFGYQQIDQVVKGKPSAGKLTMKDHWNKSYLKIKNKVNYLLIFKKDGFQNYKEFIANLHFFCFWNFNDFILMKKYFVTNAQFKYFYYTNALNLESTGVREFEGIKILINNSASPVGNHVTILNKINPGHFDQLPFELLIPLNYGSPLVKEKIISYFAKCDKKKVHMLLDFLPKDEYYTLLSNVSIAFFGARRQHAAGNIFQLLANGTKVFLRNDNNMLPLLKEWGFIVYSFEDDYQDVNDLTALSVEDRMLNNKVFNERFNQRVIDDFMQNIFK